MFCLYCKLFTSTVPNTRLRRKRKWHLITIHSCQLISILMAIERYVTIFTSRSYHLSIGIDAAVTAILGIFTTVMGVIPKFKAHGGGPSGKPGAAERTGTVKPAL